MENISVNKLVESTNSNLPRDIKVEFAKNILSENKNPEDAKKVANSGCNGVIVGSTFVKYIQDNINAPDLTQSFGKQVQSFSEVLK